MDFYFSKNWWQLLILAVVCYFIGCFNFARLISRMKKRDITKMGSGNPGTMNMSREFGIAIGALTFICDALKGGVPALISYFIYRKFEFAGTEIPVADFTRYLCGVCVVVGHIFPITSKFKGGKGIASTLGLFAITLFCEGPWEGVLGLCCLTGVLAGIYFTEMGSLSSLSGVTIFCIMQAVIFYRNHIQNGVSAYLICMFLFLLAIVLLTWFAHHKNVVRLLAGEEHRTSIKKMTKKKSKGK